VIRTSDLNYSIDGFKTAMVRLKPDATNGFETASSHCPCVTTVSAVADYAPHGFATQPLRSTDS
jgi:hypothetical protein